MCHRALLILNRLKTKIYEKLKGGRRRPLWNELAPNFHKVKDHIWFDTNLLTDEIFHRKYWLGVAVLPGKINEWTESINRSNQTGNWQEECIWPDSSSVVSDRKPMHAQSRTVAGDYRRISKINPSKYKPPKRVTQKPSVKSSLQI